MHPSVHAKTQPDKPAFIMASTGETVTYAQLDERSNQGAQLFRKLGLKTGDGIAIFMENNVHYLPLCWAAQRSGLYFTCMSSRLTAGEIEYIVKDCGAKVFITSKAMGDVARELGDRCPGVKKLMLGGTMPGYDSFEERRARDADDAGRRRNARRRHALFLRHDGQAQRRQARARSAARSTDANPLMMLAKMLSQFRRRTRSISRRRRSITQRRCAST